MVLNCFHSTFFNPFMCKVLGALFSGFCFSVFKLWKYDTSTGDLEKEQSYISVQFSCSVLSNSLRPHELQHARLSCPPTPGACSSSCPLSRWCHPTISPSVIPFLLLLPSIFPSIRVFSSELALRIRGPKHWNFSFSISHSNEYSGLNSFSMDWLDLLAVQGTLKSLLQNK